MAKVIEIAVSKNFKGQMKNVNNVETVAGKGLVGDRHFKEDNEARCQITLIEIENINYFNRISKTSIPSIEFRRNIITKGIKLNELVGNELSMQKKINLSIQMPNDKNSLLDLHSDIYAGESPFQVVVWIPLVDVYNTKSMFFTKPKHNKKMNNQLLNTDKFTAKEMYNKNKKNFKFLNIKFGDILIFSPLILHGNTINKTKETRFSLNCRFKSLLSPYDVMVKSHRNIPNFYKPLNIKPLTKIGFNYIKKYQD